MAKIDIDTQEARLLAVHRAIKEFNIRERDDLIGVADVGIALEALGQMTDLEELEKGSQEIVQSYIAGFIAGLAASNVPEQPALSAEWIPQVDEDVYVGDGPTGGVNVKQGHDDNYVTQTGVHEGQNDK